MVVLSIITPTFNGAQFLSACIKCVTQQASSEIEHIVIDGGSSDDSVQLLEEYAEKYPHLHFVSEPDKGQSDAMNKGIRMAKGSFITFLNVDDAYTENAIGEMLEEISREPKADFIAGNCECKGSSYYHLNRPLRLDPYSIVRPERYEFPANPAAYCYRRSLHDKIGYYNEEDHYSMDYGFLVAISPFIKYRYIDVTWGVFNQHPDCKTIQGLSNSKETKRISLEHGIRCWPLCLRVKYQAHQIGLSFLGWMKRLGLFSREIVAKARVRLAIRSRVRNWLGR
ncbi:MAG: glycosyltransferase family 2 protein [Acidimicrobiales bacterium]